MVLLTVRVRLLHPVRRQLHLVGMDLAPVSTAGCSCRTALKGRAFSRRSSRCDALPEAWVLMLQSPQLGVVEVSTD